MQAHSVRVAAAIAAFALAAAYLHQTAISPSAASDYLDKDLRARVEKLKTEAARPSTSAAVLAGRLETLWLWSNAYSLTGRQIPVDYPLNVFAHSRSIRAANSGQQVDLGAAGNFIRRYTAEFRTLEEIPDAAGSLKLSKAGPFRAGDYLTIEQTFTLGGKPMEPGGGLILTLGRGASPQMSNPAGDDFITVRASRPGASFSPAPSWGQFTSFITRDTLNLRLSGARLEKGDTVTITYGDTSQGSKGVKLQNFSNDRVILPVHVDLEGKGEPLTPAWPSFEILGASDVRYVSVIAPSIVKTGETIALAVRSEDATKNLASGGAPAYELSRNGDVIRTLPEGSPAMNVVTGIKAGPPGVYRFTVRTRDGSREGVSNPVWVQANPAARVFWGDTHGHTGFAEGTGSPDGYFRFGRDVARLDFLTLSEHDLWMDDWEWRNLQETTGKYDKPGAFTTILGYEWTAVNPLGGHHNVFFATPQGRRRAPVQEVQNLDELYQKLRSLHRPSEVLIIPHAHQTGDWNRNDAEMERLAEITSGHGTFEYFGNKYLQNGFEVGFVGASDNHSGHPGYSPGTNRQLGGLAAVFAARNRAPEIFQSLRSRSTYATTGERILLDVSLNGARMGQRAEDSTERRIQAKVMGTAPIDTIDVIRNGKVIYSQRGLETDLQPEMEVQVKVESSTEVFTGRKNPRGARIWRGSVEVAGAQIRDVREPWFLNPTSWRTARAAGDPNRIQWNSNTRGRGQSLLLKLSGVTPDTTVRVRLAAGREVVAQDGTTSEMMDRPAADLPAENIVFRIGDLRQGLGRRELKTGNNIDLVQVQLIPARAPLDREFSFADTDAPQSGDYYYVRVVQVDGAMAWSSPIWVGRRNR